MLAVKSVDLLEYLVTQRHGSCVQRDLKLLDGGPSGDRCRHKGLHVDKGMRHDRRIETMVAGQRNVLCSNLIAVVRAIARALRPQREP